MELKVEPAPAETIMNPGLLSYRESSDFIRERVIAARNRQQERFKGLGVYNNGQMDASMIYRYCNLDKATSRFPFIKNKDG